VTGEEFKAAIRAAGYRAEDVSTKEPRSNAEIFATLTAAMITLAASGAYAAGVALGEPCWGAKETRLNRDGLVCRPNQGGVMVFQSPTNPRWEEYRNIPSQRANALITASTKDGAACHFLPQERIVVCYWAGVTATKE